jgi:parvulin-like peptidyl-prolyl isomerase
MDNLIKLPFIESNITLLDFKKLENNGYLRPIFIELLKAEKIKNIIPTDYEIKVSAEELLLKNNINQLNKEKNNQYYFDILNKEVIKLASLKKLSIDKFGKEAKNIFDSRKEVYYDQYTYSLLRTKNKKLVFELYYQIEANETSINELSKKYSSGSERLKLGIIGPINLKDVHYEIAKILKSSNDSIINEPIEINKEWFLIKRENFVDVKFNDYYKNEICLELLENEFENEFFKLINSKC